MGRKSFLALVVMAVFAGGAISDVTGKTEQGQSGGTITGGIEARGVRDARDVVVYLERVEGEFTPPSEKPLVDQKNLVFIPHVIPVVVGTTVRFGNSDDVQHNVFSPSRGRQFNLGTYGEGIAREVTFSDPGIVAILCNVHAEMSAFVVVLQNSFYALTGPDGDFNIANVPAGTYTLVTWHEKLKPARQEVTVSDGQTTTVNLRLAR
jgi:plastocyanin